ncbi:MAG: helix-turn-helix domain-containing protein, partial [Ignavibacteria bacterium]|nr:helix-turn-helix domain-containing protein [Ignavibacteria bacterium]
DMEKISIVQRRRQNKEIETAALLRAREREEIQRHVHQYLDKIQQQDKCVPVDAPQDVPNDIRTLELELSPEQSHEISSLLPEADIMKGSTEEANVQIFRNSKDRIVFRFSVKPFNSMQMLTSEDVCNMLKISRRTLYKNVHNNEIPGYKIGSQLRFLAEDIMAYFKKNQL